MTAPAATARAFRPLAFALLAIAAALVLAPALFGTDPIYGFDTVHEKFLWRGWAFGRLARGELPAWCPNVLGGLPLVAEPIVGFWYPPNALLHLALPTGVALNLSWLLHLIVAGWGTYRLLEGRLPAESAMLGAVSYAFGAWMIGHIPLGGHPHLAVSAWTPWVVHATSRLLDAGRRASPRDVGAAALATGACVLAGHLQFVYSTFVFTGLLLVVTRLVPEGFAPATRRDRLAGACAVAVAATGGLALAGAVLVPWSELHAWSTRGHGLPREWAYSGARLVPLQLLSILAPTFFGDSVRTPYWGFPTQEMVTPYVGVVPLLLVLLPAPRAATREAWALRGIAVLGLLLAFGHGTPLYDLCRDWLPLFDRARHPARWLHLPALACAWLAGLGLAGLREERAPRRSALTALGLCALLAGTLAIIRSGTPEVGPWRRVLEARVDETTLPGGDPLRHRDAVALDQAREQSLIALARSLGFAVPAAALLALRRRLSPRALSVALLSLTMVDLLSYARVYAVPFPAAEISWPPRLRELIGPPDPEHRYVVTVLGTQSTYPGQWGRSHGNLSGIGQIWMHRGLESGHLGVQGVFSTTPADWRDLVVGPEAYDPSYAYVGPAPVLDLTAVDTVVAPADSAAPGPTWRSLGEFDGVAVWRRADAPRRAFLVHACEAVATRDEALARLRAPGYPARQLALAVGTCPPGLAPGTLAPAADEARIVDARDESVEVEVHAASAALLVLADSYFPGWQATLDGVPAEIHAVDLALRGVVVPGGTHRVRFQYHSRAQRVGLVTSAVAFTAIGTLLLLPARVRLGTQTAAP